MSNREARITERPTEKSAAGLCPPELFDRVVGILEEARTHASRTVNTAMVVSYWLIGREIVEEEQKGKKRADYGKAVIEELSRRLTGRYGKGFSTSSLWDFRRFYQTYTGRSPIPHPLGGEFGAGEILHPMGRFRCMCTTSIARFAALKTAPQSD